jgi:nucleotide-binding universal stress UspA family protein
MTIRTILVPLSGSGRDDTALTTAAMVARQFQAHVQALFVAPDAQDSVLVLGDGLSTLMVDDIVRAAETAWRGRSRNARQSFDHVVAAAGIDAESVTPGATGRATIGWREAIGGVDDVVITEGRLADLIVFAHTAKGHDLQHQQQVEAALLFTGRPVLLVPAVPQRLDRVVAVAWNVSLEATRAVGAALPWLRRAERVVVVTAGPPTDLGAKAATEDGRRLAEYLAWHGIAAEVDAFTPGADPVGGGLITQAAALGADLLVMGAYGHSRVRELILGGATRHVLTHAGLPILMVH